MIQATNQGDGERAFSLLTRVLAELSHTALSSESLSQLTLHQVSVILYDSRDVSRWVRLCEIQRLMNG